MQLIPRRQNNRRQKQIKKELIIERDTILNRRLGTQPNNQPDKHARENRQHGLMHRLDLPLLQDIAREQGEDQQHDQDEEGPGTEEFFLRRFGGICSTGKSLEIE